MQYLKDPAGNVQACNAPQAPGPRLVEITAAEVAAAPATK